jgi:hypothetical protein
MLKYSISINELGISTIHNRVIDLELLSIQKINELDCNTNNSRMRVVSDLRFSAIKRALITLSIHLKID